MKKLKQLLILFFFVVAFSVSTNAADTDYVSRIDDGQYNHYIINWDPVTGRDYVYYCSIWVDIKVANVAYDKVIGIIWTDDNWATNHVSYASYEAVLEDGSERWGLDLGEWIDPYQVTFEYCIFGEMNGQTYYDNNNEQNYKINFQY